MEHPVWSVSEQYALSEHSLVCLPPRLGVAPRSFLAEGGVRTSDKVFGNSVARRLHAEARVCVKAAVGVRHGDRA